MDDMFVLEISKEMEKWLLQPINEFRNVAVFKISKVIQLYFYCLYSLQPKMEKLYTVSKNKTRSGLWLRS